MAGTQSVSGLVSGLDTTTLISQLMQIASAPQQSLKTKQTSTQNLVTALQSLNTKVSSLGDAVTKAATATSWQALSASSSDQSVTATASSAGQPTQITFTVDRVAQAQTSLLSSSAIQSIASGQGASIVGADGSVVPLSVSSGATAQQVADAINSSGAGVTAVAINANGGYQLQLTAKSTGAAGAFGIYTGAVTKNDDGTVDTSGATAVSLTTVRTAQDAQITLWPGATNPDGSDASMAVTSSSNSFTGVVPGLTFTVSQPTTDAVTVSTSRDDGALTKLASDLVGQLNLVLGEITSQTTSQTSTADDGSTNLTPGVLGGQSDVMFLQQATSDAGAQAVTYNGQLVSPASVGIVVNDDGTFTFDQDAFAASLAADPDKTQAVVSAIAQRVASVATTYSDPSDGLLTSNVTQQQQEVKDLGDQISDWNVRLQLQQQSLEDKYNAMETALSQLQAQSSYLSSTLGSIGTSSTSSSSKSSS